MTSATTRTTSCRLYKCVCLPRVRTQRIIHFSTMPTTTTKCMPAANLIELREVARDILLQRSTLKRRTSTMVQLLDPITQHSIQCTSTATQHAGRRGPRAVGDVKTILVDWFRCLHTTRRSRLRIRTQSPDGEPLRFENCIFVPRNCKCYGY